MRPFHLKPKNIIFIGLFISFLLGLTLFSSTPAHAHGESVEINSTQIESAQADASMVDSENSAGAFFSLGSFGEWFAYGWDWAEYIGWHLNPWTEEPEPERPEPIIMFGFAWSG